MSLLPDWLHPWRWYAATVIVEALYRHCVLQEPAHIIAARFGRSPDAGEWKSLRRWRGQLLISPTLWGWLGPRLGVTKAAVNKTEAKGYIERLLGEAGLIIRSSTASSESLCMAVRKSLCDLIHNRKTARPLRHFLPGTSRTDSSGRIHSAFPTEKDSGPDPP